MEKVLTAPVLFMVFNRPEKTRQVFDAIKAVKPRKLYVAVDAPRPHVASDTNLCRKVKDIVSAVDWDCDVKYLFHSENLGCTLAGKTAWDWIFGQEEEMIFVEDDGLASPTFFFYCQELLEKYKNDPRIAYIGGVNYGLKKGNTSYFFTRVPAATYCMATWKRVYDLYEYKIDSYESTRNTRSFKNSFNNSFEYKFITRKLDNYKKNGGNTYDLQMIYLVHKYKMLSIYPNINLVSNIGLDYGGANNNIDPDSDRAKMLGNRPRFDLEPDRLIHPDSVETNREFEKKCFRQRYLYDESWIKSRYNFYLRPKLLPVLGPVYRSLKRVLHNG